MTTENQIEKGLIDKLTDLKYLYRQDIRDLDAPEKKIHDKVNLTDSEFFRLRDEIVSANIF